MNTNIATKIDFDSAMLDAALKRTPKGRVKGTVSKCVVCGKDESRNSKAVNDASPNHALVLNEKYHEKARDIEKRLQDKSTDLTARGVLVKAAEEIGKLIKAARAEHDQYNETAELENKQQSVSDKRKLIELAQTLAGKMGVKLVLRHIVKVPEETIEEVATVDGVEVKTTKTIEAHDEEQDRSPLMLFTDVAAAFDALTVG